MEDSTSRFRRAERDDVPAIVRLLAADPLGSTREVVNGDQVADAYWRAFQAIDADPHQLLMVAEVEGRVVGTLQLTTDQRRPDAVRFYESLGFRASHIGMKLSLWG